MPSKYGKGYKVPSEFPSLLKAFTREVLRAQPADIYEFGAEYFSELLAQSEAAQNEQSQRVHRLSQEELTELLSQMFHEADVDNSGALSMGEFKSVLQMADLGLSDVETKRVMAEADCNADGEISYDEFIPLAVEMVQTMYAKMETQEARKMAEDEAREEAKYYLLHGMSKDEVEGVMTEIFRKSDIDGSGALSLTEFRNCCRDADIGLTRKEINVLMHQCDMDGDGNISYEEFVPLCFEMLTEILKDELLENKRDPSELEVLVMQACAEKDAARTGTLDAITMKDMLRSLDLGLTRLQIHSILAEASYDEEGMCTYRKFIPTASELIYKMLDMDYQRERNENLKSLAGTEDFNIIHGYGQDDLQSVLTQELMAYDTAQTERLSERDLVTALSNSSLGLSEKEVSALMSAAERDEAGVKYVDLASYAFYILQYLTQSALTSQ